MPLFGQQRPRNLAAELVAVNSHVYYKGWPILRYCEPWGGSLQIPSRLLSAPWRVAAAQTTAGLQPHGCGSGGLWGSSITGNGVTGRGWSLWWGCRRETLEQNCHYPSPVNVRTTAHLFLVSTISCSNKNWSIFENYLPGKGETVPCETFFWRKSSKEQSNVIGSKQQFLDT